MKFRQACHYQATASKALESSQWAMGMKDNLSKISLRKSIMLTIRSTSLIYFQSHISNILPQKVEPEQIEKFLKSNYFIKFKFQILDIQYLFDKLYVIKIFYSLINLNFMSSLKVSSERKPNKFEANINSKAPCMILPFHRLY